MNSYTSNNLVSVIIPAYNAEKCIADVLESVYVQTYRPIELIVVDDGSTDNTRKVIERYVQNVRDKTVRHVQGRYVQSVRDVQGKNVRLVHDVQDVRDGEKNEIVKDFQSSETDDRFEQAERSNEQSDRTIQACLPDEVIDITYIFQQNGGPSKARNTGIKVSKGKFIAFLDSDDIWMPHKLEKQMQLFEREKDIDIAFTDVKVIKHKSGVTETDIFFKKHKLNGEFFGHGFIVKNPLEKLLKVNFMLTPAVVVKRSCFGNGFYFNEKRDYAEDWELWLKMALKYTFGYVDEVCVQVDDEGDGLRSHVDQMLLSKIKVLDEFLKTNESDVSYHLSGKKLAVPVRETYKWTGYYFMRHGEKKLARELYKKSMAMRPDIKTLLYYYSTFL
jgi:glycosyltransferase involved in cell wall biosynthesis